jgi:hypothetical protein
MAIGKVLGANGVDGISAYDFGTVIVENPVPIKFGFLNNKTRIVSPVIAFLDQKSDMENFMGAIMDTVTLSIPYNLAIEQITTTSVLVTGEEYFYCVEAYNCNGRTGQSLEVSVIIESGKTPKLIWSPIAGADGYYIYRSLLSMEYTDSLITQIASGNINTFTDTGTLSGNGTPSAENLSGGTAPTYGTAPAGTYYPTLALGSIAIGQEKFFWINCYAPLGTTEDDNPRACLMRISE